MVSSFPESAVLTLLFPKVEASLLLPSTYSVSTCAPSYSCLSPSLLLFLCPLCDPFPIPSRFTPLFSGGPCYTDMIFALIYHFLISLITQSSQQVWSASPLTVLTMSP